MNPMTSIIPHALGNSLTLTFANLQDVVATSAGIGTEQSPFLPVPKAENSAIAVPILNTVIGCEFQKEGIL